MEVLGLGFEEWRVSRGARKAVEVLPESEVDEMRGKLELEEGVARPMAVPCPVGFILEDLELAFVMLEASTRVSVPLSSRSLSLSRFELDLGIEGVSG